MIPEDGKHSVHWLHAIPVVAPIEFDIFQNSEYLSASPEVLIKTQVGTTIDDFLIS